MDGWARFLCGLVAGMVLSVVILAPWGEKKSPDPLPSLPSEPQNVAVELLGVYPLANGAAVVLLSPQVSEEWREELADVEGKVLPIYIGMFEAQAIQREMDGLRPPRPMTHDLLRNTIGDLGCRVERVTVTEIKDGVYYAKISIVRADGTRAEIDARPSDSLALAARVGAPVYVAREVFDIGGEDPGKATALPVETEESRPDIFF